MVDLTRAQRPNLIIVNNNVENWQGIFVGESEIFDYFCSQPLIFRNNPEIGICL